MAKQTAALAKLQSMESRRLAAAARARSLAKQAWDTQQHTLVAGGTAFGLGFAESRGVALPTIDGFDPSALYAALAFTATLFIKDRRIKRVAESVTDGLLGVAAYKAGRGGFQSLFQYTAPTAPAAAVPAVTAGAAPIATSGYGDEIVNIGAF